MSTEETTLKPVDATSATALPEPSVDPVNETTSGVPAAQRQAMEELPPNHTYRDRVEAQARALGIKIEEGWTLERLMFEIRMQASA